MISDVLRKVLGRNGSKGKSRVPSYSCLEMCAFIFAGAFSKLKTKNEMGAFIPRSAQGAPATRPANYDVDTTQLRFRLL